MTDLDINFVLSLLDAVMLALTIMMTCKLFQRGDQTRGAIWVVFVAVWAFLLLRALIQYGQLL
jgi:hypothetical protein